MKFFTILYLTFIISCNGLALPAEPVCSKFDYEMKTLEAMLRTEQKMEKMVEDVKAIRETILKELGEIKDFKSQLLVDFDTLKDTLKNQTGLEQEQRQEEIKQLWREANEKLELVDNALEVTNNKPRDQVVAFTVGKPSGSTVNGVPIFTKVITNIGDGYNIDTGIFTSPIGGMYSFVFIVASSRNKDVYCRIFHNDSIVAFGRTYSDNSYTTAAAAVNLVLSKGDKVRLDLCGGWTNVYSGNGDTTFSGSLIKQTVPDN